MYKKVFKPAVRGEHAENYRSRFRKLLGGVYRDLREIGANSPGWEDCHVANFANPDTPVGSKSGASRYVERNSRMDGHHLLKELTETGKDTLTAAGILGLARGRMAYDRRNRQTPGEELVEAENVVLERLT